MEYISWKEFEDFIDWWEEDDHNFDVAFDSDHERIGYIHIRTQRLYTLRKLFNYWKMNINEYEPKSFLYCRTTMEDVISTLCTLEKNTYAYVISDYGSYYIEGEHRPFIENEKILYKGKVIDIIDEITKDQKI